MRPFLLAPTAAILLACHAPASSGSNGGSCTQLLAEAYDTVEQASSDVLCGAAADCVIASNRSACAFACGVVVNEAGAAALGAAITQVNATTCAAFLADGCKPNAPPPCVGYFGPYCLAGRCSGSPSVDDAGVEAGSETSNVVCAEETDAAQAAVAEAVAVAGLGCDADSDCARVSTITACSGICSLAIVNQASASVLQQAIVRISTGDCPDFLDGGCPPWAQPPCPLGPAAGCVAGSCTAVP